MYNKLDLKLVDRSIDKWKRIVYHGECDGGATDCALCVEYNRYYSECIHCPIFIDTKGLFCCNTPYKRWSILAGRRNSFAYWCVEDDTTRRAANNMLIYLHELRYKIMLRLSNGMA